MKRQCERALRLRMLELRQSLRPGLTGGQVRWESGSAIGFDVLGDPPAALRLRYRVGELVKDYWVGLSTITAGFGNYLHWYFHCPGCGRRCLILYLPPGESVFKCRRCHNLIYRSSQEQHQGEGMLKRLGAELGMTPGDMNFVLGLRKRPPKNGLVIQQYRQAAQEYLERQAARQAEIAALIAQGPHPDYLTAGDLCERAGLSPGELQALESARLLIPDTKDGRYRPKLAGWACKLAYLLRAGWALGEVRAWARGRWSTANPRAWPPDRAAWQELAQESANGL